ncbi:MAG: helix-turn-helix transcriptional regulator [Verrucomicrobiota bacterium]|nr:helix-turn-helix transcriptional regulator [Verrucomicrobiota bacterium]
MGALGPAIFGARPGKKIRAGRPLPTKGQLYGPWLCRGERVSVYYDCLEPCDWPEHYHRQAELFLTFDAARAQVAWRGPAGRLSIQLVAARQYCLIPPNLVHACDWKIHADIVVVYIEESLLKEYVSEPLDSVVVGDFQPLTRLDACLWSLCAIFHDLCRQPETPPASFIENIGAALASRTLEQHFHGNGGNGTASQPHLPRGALHRLVEYLDAHLREPVAVADLARHVGLGAGHFTRLLKTATGSSPLQFVLKHRVQKALELLRTGEFRVAEAAYEVGFCDQSHLDRHCRKFFGFPPSAAARVALTADSF